MRSCLNALAILALTLGFLSACQPATETALILPEGDVDRGRELFLRFQCLTCHSLPEGDIDDTGVEREYNIPLGGPGVRTYPGLVTSIINPSHRVARLYRLEVGGTDPVSPMSNYNDIMTVTQLTDLVTFLQSQYRIEHMPRYRYVPYTYSE